jgi:hypothetical protein
MKMATSCVIAGVMILARTGAAQPRPYAGALGGIATLSADSQIVVASNQAAASSYKPENGVTTDVYFGLHCNNYLSVQADYLWARNPVTLDGLSGGALTERMFQAIRTECSEMCFSTSARASSGCGRS